MNTRSSQNGPGLAAPAAPARGRGRGGRGGRGRGGRGGAGRGSGSSPAPAPSGTTGVAVPPAPIQLDVGTATVVEASTPLADLPCQAVLGGLGGSEPQTDPDRVFLYDGQCLSDFDSGYALALSPSVGKLLLSVPPTSEESNWSAAGRKADGLLQGGGDGSLAFRQKLARSAMAECLVRLALGAGALRTSVGCVVLPSEQQILSRTLAAAPPAPAAAPANLAAAAGAGVAPGAAPAPSPAARPYYNPDRNAYLTEVSLESRQRLTLPR